MRRLWEDRHLGSYAAVTGAALALALLIGWSALGNEIDNYAYDLLLHHYAVPPHDPGSIIVAIDDATLNVNGGVHNYRPLLARGLDAINAGHPAVVALDMVLADASDPVEDRQLAASFARTHNLVLSAERVADEWEEPLPLFASNVAAIGHVHAIEESSDGMTRSLTLEQTAAHRRHWALALEAFRLFAGARIIESPDELRVGRVIIPARVRDQRPMRIRYTAGSLPSVSLTTLLHDSSFVAQLRGKTVFLGVTSQSAAHDRAVTPYGDRITGVEVHAQAFETLRGGHFLRDASNLEILASCLLIAGLALSVFAYTSGWHAYALGALLLASAHIMPIVAFAHDVVFPYSAPFATAWLCVSAAASFQHFVVRRMLRKTEDDKERYQRAIRFVTHEMKTPLTAIQGSSELIGRYNLSEDKRKQMATMIHSESKRLAGMIQTFLNVERLSEGEMRLKHDVFPVSEVVESSLQRIGPIAERKDISIHCSEVAGVSLRGDRELMEYAVYNLLTNAVKYSPAGTDVKVTAFIRGDWLHVAVSDQGMGMDDKELRSIFRKFYRTKRAEASGESGTGIGLSIVEQIVTHHGGRMEVTSIVGKGSCFTVVVPYVASANTGTQTSKI